MFIFKSKILPPTKAQIHVGLVGPGDFHSVASTEMSSSPYPRVEAGSAGGGVSPSASGAFLQVCEELWSSSRKRCQTMGLLHGAVGGCFFCPEMTVSMSVCEGEAGD